MLIHYAILLFPIKDNKIRISNVQVCKQTMGGSWDKFIRSTNLTNRMKF